MSLKNRALAHDYQRGRISGRFAVGATGAVGTKTGDVGRWTVVRDSAGVYTVTLVRKPKKIMAANGSIRKAAAGDLAVQLQTITESTGKVTFRCQTTGATPAATDPASGDDFAFWIDVEP